MSFVIPILIVLVASAAIGEQSSPGALPSEIPSAPVDGTEILRGVVGLAEQIEDHNERFRALVLVLYQLEPFSPAQRVTIVEALEAAARHVDQQTLVSSRESVVQYAPETAVRIARRIEDQRRRDLYLADIVPELARNNPERAGELLKEIEHPEARPPALVAYAINAPLSYGQVEVLLIEAATTSWPEHSRGPWTYSVAEALTRFAREQPSNITAFLRGHFKPDEAVAVLVRLAWKLTHRLHAPGTARKFVEQAMELVPRTDQPAEAAVRVIHGGYSQLQPAEAQRLFDTFILPGLVRGERGSEYPLSLLALVDMNLLASRAEAVAEARHARLMEILPKAVGRAAHEADPDRVVRWLEAQPASPIQSACAVEILGTMRFTTAPREIRQRRAREPIRILSEIAGRVDDPRTQWRIYDGLLVVADSADLKAPRDVLDRWRELWSVLEKETEARERQWVMDSSFHRLPLDEQERRIARRLDPDAGGAEYWKREEHPPWATLRLISRSSLAKADKEQFLERMAEQAEANPLAVAAIAGELASYDYPDALKLMWKALPDTRNPASTGSGTFGIFPPLKPPENATTALQWLRDGRKAYLQHGRSEDLTEVLWSHARSVPDPDRDPLLEELVHVLLEAGQLETALGVTQFVRDLPRRILLMAEVANHSTSVRE
ncbi:MAG: hypothetical protein KY476_10700 [Planctomycetes bacterium]|nr:hypothetical protein [Planctomycetota bacterium]